MRNILLVVFSVVLLLLSSCKENTFTNGSEIINQSIEAHGSHLLESSTMQFTFREVKYNVSRDDGDYEYVRFFVKDSLEIMDLLDNAGAHRFIDGQLQNVTDSLLTQYGSSVNSVVYFAQLPYGLNGPAVYKELIGEKTIKNNNYYKVKVTFDPNGGGEDHEDEFIYWIDQETYLIDYLAYSYCEEECGFRFRESVNRRTINGVIIQDYNNYKETVQDPDLSVMDELFITGKLKLLSEIKTEEVRIEL